MIDAPPTLWVPTSGNGFALLVPDEEISGPLKIGHWVRPYSREECAATLRQMEADLEAGVWCATRETLSWGVYPNQRKRRGFRWKAIGRRGYLHTDWIDPADGISYTDPAANDWPPTPRRTTAAERWAMERRAA